MTRTLLLCLSISLAAAACCTRQLPEEQERGVLKAKMLNLSSAVEAYFLTLRQAPQGSDEEILKAATTRQPEALAPEFQRYKLRVQYQNPAAVLLLCTGDGKQAIMEDAGCSAALDDEPDDVIPRNRPCEFTLRVGSHCAVQGALPR